MCTPERACNPPECRDEAVLFPALFPMHDVFNHAINRTTAQGMFLKE